MEDDQEYEGGYGDDGMDQDEDEFGDEEPLEQEQEEQQEVRWGCLGRGVWGWMLDSARVGLHTTRHAHTKSNRCRLTSDPYH